MGALEALAAALVPILADAIKNGLTREDIFKTTEAAMITASDAEMQRELGPDASPKAGP